MLKQYTADLHIHTCLSPCGELEMSPSAIVNRASEIGLDIIAITDHNSAENVAAALRAAEKSGLTVLAGMEVASSEEAHILALFNDAECAMKLQDRIYAHLLPGENDEKRFGEQVVVNEKEEVLSFNKRLLIAASQLTAHEIVQTVHALGGLAVASHIDKDVYSILSQLGFIPEDLKFDALEMSSRIERKQAEQLFMVYNSYPWISSSDAHHINDIGKRTTIFIMNKPTVEEMALAMRGIEGRRVEWK